MVLSVIYVQGSSGRQVVLTVGRLRKVLKRRMPVILRQCMLVFDV